MGNNHKDVPHNKKIKVNCPLSRTKSEEEKKNLDWEKA